VFLLKGEVRIENKKEKMIVKKGQAVSPGKASWLTALMVQVAIAAGTHMTL
jgi:hypothetical protein